MVCFGGSGSGGLGATRSRLRGDVERFCGEELSETEEEDGGGKARGWLRVETMSEDEMVLESE